MNAPASITITPVRVADLLAEDERMPVYLHVIDHPDARVLVDTGMTELHPAAADLDPRLRRVFARGARARRALAPGIAYASRQDSRTAVFHRAAVISCFRARRRRVNTSSGTGVWALNRTVPLATSKSPRR